MERLVHKCIFSILYLISFNFYAQGNGSKDLCNKRYNEVAYLTTHNAFNSKQDRFLFPNQKSNIIEQLNNGERGLMIDVYDDNGSTVVYHAYKFLGHKPLSIYLNNIKFLMNHIIKCKDLKNKFPNFITVDFFEIGESLDVVSKLNMIK